MRKKEKFSYPVYSARVDQDIKDWLKEESAKYKSPNVFLKKLKQIYEKR